MMILVDVHCHLESPELAGDLSGHIAEGEKAGVRAFITAAVAGSSKDSWAMTWHQWQVE